MNGLLKNILYVLVLCAAVAGYSFWHYSSLEKATLSYSIDAAKAITNSWDATELKNRAHPTLKAALRESAKSIEEYFQIYAQLGKVNRIRSCQLATNATSLIGSTEKFKIADYACYGEFKNGDATIRISLRQDDPVRAGDEEEEWQITTFRVESPLFVKR